MTEYYEWRIDRTLLPDGTYGVVCYFRDISAYVQARLELQHSRGALRRYGRRKSECLSRLHAFEIGLLMIRKLGNWNTLCSQLAARVRSSVRLSVANC